VVESVGSGTNTTMVPEVVPLAVTEVLVVAVGPYVLVIVV